MPGRFERFEPVVMRGVVFAFGSDIDEEAVVAVKRGIAERLAVDRDQALAVLAGGFGDQLFGPGAEIGDLRRRGNRHLVAAFEAGEPHRQPELHARVFMWRHVGAAGAHHRKRVRDQAANVDTGGSRRHQPERRQHGVASADRRIAVEDAGKALLGRNLLQRRAGIGDGDEAMTGLVLADRFGDAIEEIILHRVRLGGAAGFAGDDEQRVGEIDRILHRAHLRGIGGIEHVQLREAGFFGERFRQHFRPEARSAHAEHDGIAEILSLHAAGKILVVGDVGGRGAVQPAQPFVLVVTGPDRFVLLPQAADCRRCAPILGALLHGLPDAVAERELLPVDAAAERGRALLRDRAIELVGGIRKQLDAVLDQFFRDGVERDAGLFEFFQHAPCVLDILLEAVPRLAMVAECIERCRRHGVDGVGADQFLDIQHIAVVLVLGAGGRPQQTLRLGALGRELLPAGACEQPLVVLIGQLGVGDGDLALQRAQPLLLAGVIGPRDLVVELLVDRGIDAADEERGDAGDRRGIAALGDVFFEARDIGLRHLAIDLLREQQRDVDADAFADQMFDRRQPFRRGRHLHHQVLPLDVLPEPFGFRDGPLGVHRQIGRDLEADETVIAVQAVVNRAQHVGGVLDVLDGDRLEQVGDGAVARLQRLTDRAVILVRTADRLFEDRGVRRHALDAVGIDQRLEVALGDEAAGEEVQPDRLAMVFECFDGIHGACSVRSVFSGFRQLSGAGPESQHLVGRAAGWNGAVRDDNAIGTGSIPKMAGLAGLDIAGSVEPAFGMATPTGTRTKS